MKKVQYAIEIVDRWSKPYASFERKTHYLNRKRVDPFKGTAQSINKSNSLLNDSNQKIKNLIQSENSAINKTIRWDKAIAAVGSSYLALQAGKAVWNFSKDAVMASAQIEKYNVTLKTMLGSTSAARDRMQEYFDIAKKTPFELNQVVEAGNQLQAIGRYNAENLTNLGDLAAASGKPIEQVLNAYAKLATGQKGEAVNMFRDLLISTDDWVKATGKGIKNNGELKATTEEMIAALPGLLKGKGYLGMMAQQSKTTEGQMSNLKDTVFQLKVGLGDHLRPAFSSVMDTASKMVDTMREWVEVPVSEKMRQEKVEANLLTKKLGDLNISETERARIFNELKTLQPDIVEGISAENIEMDKLLLNLRQYNVEMSKRIFLQKKQEEIDSLKQKATEAETKAYEKLAPVQERMMNIINVAKQTRPELANVVEDAFFGKYWEQSARNELFDSMGAEVYSMLNQAGFDNAITEKDRINAEANLVAELARLTGQWDALDNLWGNSSFGSVSGSEYSESLAYWNKSKNYQFAYRNLEQGLEEFQEKLGINLDAGPVNSSSNNSVFGSSFTPLSTQVQQAQDTITGGGKNVKVVNINLESLINENNNVFTQGQDPADADDFMDKLINAFASVVNDTNMMVR